MSNPTERTALGEGEEGLLQSWEVNPADPNTLSEQMMDQILGEEMDTEVPPNEMAEASDEEYTEPIEEVRDDETEESDSDEDAVSDEEESADSEGEEDEEESQDHRDLPEDTVLFEDPQGNPVTVQEARAGYLRQADYTRKTQELSAERSQTIQAREQALSEIPKVVSALQDVEAVFEQLAGDPPDQALRQSDPGEFAAQVSDYQTRQHMLSAIRQRRALEAQKAQDLFNAQQQEVLAEESRKLREKMPEWRDENRFNEDLTAIATHFQSEYGYTQDELGQVQDHRALIIMRKAMEYDRLQAEGSKVTTGPRDAAKKPSSRPKPKGQKRPRSKDGRFQQDRQKALEQQSARLNETGSVYDAARAIELALGDDI